jgi:XTP/dITP diphosphohydrolase
MELWIGTTNKGKLSEMKLLIDKASLGLQVKSLADLPTYVQPPENGKTFLDNARLKARSLKAMKPGVWCLAEDSGLEVEELGNLPGIHSARYAGPKAADSENVAKLLKMLQIKNASHRKARFLCTMVVFDPQGTEHILSGEMKGSIAKQSKGQNGFGYDPVFVPEGKEQSLAELGLAYKNAHSHRAQATLSLIDLLKRNLV